MEEDKKPWKAKTVQEIKSFQVQEGLQACQIMLWRLSSEVSKTSKEKDQNEDIFGSLRSRHALSSVQ